MVPLYDSSIDGITVTALAHQCYAIEFARIPPEGQFVQLQLPAGFVVNKDVWTNDEMVLKVVGNSPAGVDIGIRPAPGYGGEAVTAMLYTTPGTRTASTPPMGPRNAVMDLTIIDLGAGRMRLEWTENNNGDYNFDSIVGVSDLTPLGVNYLKSYTPGSGGEMNTTIYWVDGDRNGEINVTDITPIGQNFNNTIGGYNVLRNGVVIPVASGEIATVPRSAAEMRSMLPPRYAFEFETLPSDEWVVAPVDWKGVEGVKSSSVSLPGDADLQVNLENAGLDLFDLNGSGEFGPLGSAGRCELKVVDPWEILRRIDPGDVPNLMPVGNGQDADTPHARFYDLPRRQALALLVMYAPVNDLADGQPKSGSSLHGASQAIAIEHETTVIPFRLPAAGTTYLDIEITLADNPAGGYFTDILTDTTFDSVAETKHVQLNNRDALVSMDNDQDDDTGLEFADEAQLSDPDRLAASDMRLQREVDADDYNNSDERTVFGRLGTLDESHGTLELFDVYISQQDGYNQQETLSILFSEDSDFIGLLGDMIPGELAVGEYLRLKIDLLDDPALDPQLKYWMRACHIDQEVHFPIANLAATPTSGAAPLFVAFDASHSVDIFGGIVKYEFDFDDGGGWVDYGLTDSAVYTYANEGTYLAKLRVTDTELNQDIDDITITVGDLIGEGTVNIGITINFNGWTTTSMTTRVAIYDHEPAGITDIDWIGLVIGDPNPYGRQDTEEPADGVEQILTWNGIVDGMYWYTVYRTVTDWEGGIPEYAEFGPFTVSGASVHDFSHIGDQSGDPPPPS